MLVIEDDEGPTSIAGVMGGARSEVHDGTTRVLMEAANWVGPNIHRTSQVLGLRSEASGRFEKGLSPEQAMEAQALATKLMLALTGATLRAGHDRRRRRGPGAEDDPAAHAEGRATPRHARSRATGRPRSSPRSSSRCAEADDGLDVTVPHFRRNDVYREADLIEEVARIDGLEKLPGDAARAPRASGVLTVEQRLRRRAVDALAGRGLNEIVGWSFTDPGVADRLRLEPATAAARFVALENPMSEQQSVMRTMLLGSLLDAARVNASHGQSDLPLFEQGAVYSGARAGRRPNGASSNGGDPRRGGMDHRSRSSTARSAGSSPGACTAELGHRRAAPRRVLRGQGLRRGGGRRPAGRLDRRARDRAVPAPGPQRADPRRRRAGPVGWIGESTRSSRARRTSTAPPPRSSSTSDGSPPRRRRSRPTAT